MTLWDDLRVHPGIGNTRRHTGRRQVEDFEESFDDPDSTLRRRAGGGRRSEDPHDVTDERTAIGKAARFLAASPLIWGGIMALAGWGYRLEQKTNANTVLIEEVRHYGTQLSQAHVASHQVHDAETIRMQEQLSRYRDDITEIKSELREVKALLIRQARTR